MLNYEKLSTAHDYSSLLGRVKKSDLICEALNLLADSRKTTFGGGFLGVKTSDLVCLKPLCGFS